MNPVLIYDLEGNYLDECESSKAACLLIKAEQSLVSKALNGYILSVNDFQVRKKTNGDLIMRIGDITGVRGNSMIIGKYWNDRLISTYISIEDVSQRTNISGGSISRSIKDGTKVKGFVFKVLNSPLKPQH